MSLGAEGGPGGGDRTHYARAQFFPRAVFHSGICKGRRVMRGVVDTLKSIVKAPAEPHDDGYRGPNPMTVTAYRGSACREKRPSSWGRSRGWRG